MICHSCRNIHVFSSQRIQTQFVSQAPTRYVLLSYPNRIEITLKRDRYRERTGSASASETQVKCDNEIQNLDMTLRESLVFRQA